MTFKHKLSQRLARLKDRVVAVAATFVATALVFACEKPLAVTDPGNSKVAHFVVSPKNTTLNTGQSAVFQAVALASTGDTVPVAVTWSASRGSIIDTGTTGGRHYGRYAAGPDTGRVNVVATAHPGEMADTATVVVSRLPVASVTVTPATATVAVGQTGQLTATPKDASGNALSGRSIAWLSSDTTVARVSGSGLVTGMAAGSATITATSEGASGTASLTVTAVPVASVTVSPASASLQVGQTAQLSATAKDAGGNPLSGRVVTWASSNAGVASVSGSGLVTAQGAGSATITATSEGKTGTAAITVTDPPATGCSSQCHYVDGTAGNDANPGTSSAPWRTIQHAADLASPGDTTIVNDGVYTGGANVVTINQSGTAGSWLVFRAAHPWQAVIDGQNNSSSSGIAINGSYVWVEGFEVRNTSRYGIDAYNGHDVAIVGNHVHDIGHVCTDDVGGRVGVDAYARNLTIERNLIHDVGRLGPGEGGCTPVTTAWQNHDHGIYQGSEYAGQSDNLMVRNNLFYHFTHGWAIQRYDGSGTSVDGLSILNNTFVGANPWRDGQIIIATGATNLVIENNIFYQPTTAGVWFDTGGLTNVTLSNNLAFGAAVSEGGTGITASGNVLNLDPRFVNVSGLDFHVQAGSPAIGAGLSLSSVLNDFDGVLRSGAYTIGAYQFH